MSKTEIKKSSLLISENGIEKATSKKRLEVLKTYKIYIGGQFQELSPADIMFQQMRTVKNWPMFVLVQEKTFGMLLLLQEVHLEVGVQELLLTVDKFFIAWLKCWKEEKHNSLKS
jgi:hypothetical protein